MTATVGLATRIVGAAFGALGAFVLLAMFNGAHIDDHHRTLAWGRWQRAPSAESEAAWRQEANRVWRNEAILAAAAVLMLGLGGYLVVKR